MADDLGALVAKLAADVTDLKKGLQQGRQEFTSFQNLIETGAAKIKSVLAFAGISLGLYALASEVKAFGASILETGQKSEVLRGAMYAIGQYYNISSAALDLYINKLTEMGISQENALQSVNNFLKAGLSVDLLPQIAAATRDLAPTMAMSFNEAFPAVIEAITKQTPKALAAMAPQLKQALKAMLSESGKEIDAVAVSGTQKAQMMVDLYLEAGQKVKGAGDSMAGTYLRQLQDYQRAVREVKEALFEIVKPISMAITGSEIKSWQDLYVWVVQNKTALKEAAQGIADFIQNVAGGVKAVAAFIWQHKEMATILLEVYVLSKAAGWFIGVIGGITTATTAVGGLLVQLGLLRAAVAGPWGLLIAVSIVGIGAALKQAQELSKFHPEYVGGAEWVPSEEYKAGGLEVGRKERYKPSTAGTPSPMGGYYGQKPEKSPAEAKAEVDEAARKALLENKLPPKGGKGGGKGAGAEEDLLGEHMRMLEAQRHADLAAAADQIQILKATLDQKRALLAQDLATGLIDGGTYYQKLQEMEKQETAAALAEIAKKRQAQTDAYRDELTVLTQQQAQGKFSAEVGAERSAALAAKNRQEMAKFDMEAAKLRLDGEKKITDELTKQLEIKKQYTQQTEDLNVDTAQLMGAISSQEATLQKLVLDWQRTKDEAIKAGITNPNSPAYVPGYAAALDKNLEAKKADTLYGGYASQITQGISSLADALMSGGQDLMNAANTMFKGLFNEAMKPGLDQLKGLLVSGFKNLFGESGGAIASGVMGVVGLLGMMLTSSKTKSSWTPSSITSSVTSHEAVRGVIAGENSIPIAEIGTSFQDALVETNGLLGDIKAILGAGGGGGGSTSINVTFENIQEAVSQALDNYFASGLQLGKT